MHGLSERGWLSPPGTKRAPLDALVVCEMFRGVSSDSPGSMNSCGIGDSRTYSNTGMLRGCWMDDGAALELDGARCDELRSSALVFGERTKGISSSSDDAASNGTKRGEACCRLRG